MSWLQSEPIPHGVSLQKHSQAALASQKYHPDQLTPLQTSKDKKDTKKTPTDTARCPQTLKDNPQTLLKCMIEPDWSHFSKTVKGKNFVHLPFLRHQNIKTSLYPIYKNV